MLPDLNNMVTAVWNQNRYLYGFKKDDGMPVIYNLDTGKKVELNFVDLIHAAKQKEIDSQ